MSVTQTFTVTVVSTGSGNKYVIDGSQQKTLNLIEGKTYRFDQTHESNKVNKKAKKRTADRVVFRTIDQRKAEIQNIIIPNNVVE